MMTKESKMNPINEIRNSCMFEIKSWSEILSKHFVMPGKEALGRGFTSAMRSAIKKTRDAISKWHFRTEDESNKLFVKTNNVLDAEWNKELSRVVKEQKRELEALDAGMNKKLKMLDLAHKRHLESLEQEYKEAKQNFETTYNNQKEQIDNKQKHDPKLRQIQVKISALHRKKTEDFETIRSTRKALLRELDERAEKFGRDAEI
jgi:hypothetical protein